MISTKRNKCHIKLTTKCSFLNSKNQSFFLSGNLFIFQEFRLANIFIAINSYHSLNEILPKVLCKFYKYILYYNVPNMHAYITGIRSQNQRE